MNRNTTTHKQTRTETNKKPRSKNNTKNKNKQKNNPHKTQTKTQPQNRDVTGSSLWVKQKDLLRREAIASYHLGACK